MKKIIVLLILFSLAFMPTYPGWDTIALHTDEYLVYYEGYTNTTREVDMVGYTGGCNVELYYFQHGLPHFQEAFTMATGAVRAETLTVPRLYCYYGVWLHVTSDSPTKWLSPDPYLSTNIMLPIIGGLDGGSNPYPAPKAK